MLMVNYKPFAFNGHEDI